jgi:twitching motility two-component system response regulator PilG
MNKGNILIVEDEESLMMLERILLSLKGYHVTGVKDGKTALSAIAANAPDLVLLDIMLPEIDGFEVCRTIKGNPATSMIPVIMLTAKKSSQDAALGMKVGADAYLTKPFKSAKVIETIEGLLGTS